MDFKLRKMFGIDYLNDDSTGTVRGDENDKRATILPSTVRVNYSLCDHKNKVYIYGGLSPNENKVLSSMEVYECMTFKFNPVKYRGDHTPAARQGHCALILNQYNMVVIGGTYADSLLTAKPVPDNDLIWIYDLESG